MCLIWALYRYLKNPSVVDVGWASGLTIVGLVYLYSALPSLRTIGLSLVLLLWGLRLGGYLWFTRIRRGIIDKRYLNLSENWKIAKPLGFFLNFQLQGALIFIVSLPWFFISKSPQQAMSLFNWICILLAILSIITESVADYQLQVFKAAHPGKVCNQGLWFYSRHPNYFFEWLTWFAFSLLALPSSYGWLALISPLTLYYIMTKITGKMTEAQSIKSRGQDYLEYQKLTPMFFPKLFIKRK